MHQQPAEEYISSWALSNIFSQLFSIRMERHFLVVIIFKIQDYCIPVFPVICGFRAIFKTFSSVFLYMKWKQSLTTLTEDI